MWFPNRSDTNQAVKSKLEISDLRRRGSVLSVKGKQRRDQLRGYREANLRLCFRLCKLLVFSRGGSKSSLCFQ